jgi:hypothetical protein
MMLSQEILSSFKFSLLDFTSTAHMQHTKMLSVSQEVEETLTIAADASSCMN